MKISTETHNRAYCNKNLSKNQPKKSLEFALLCRLGLIQCCPTPLGLQRLAVGMVALLALSCSGCGGLFVTPQIPTGGLNSNAPEESPAYSSDGRYLAFASDRAGARNIYLFDLQQRALVPLPNLNRRDSAQDQPSLSADGRYIAYVSSERGKPDIFVYDRETARSQLLTANVRGTVARPTISGDGRSVAFQTAQRGQWNIAIVDR